MVPPPSRPEPLGLLVRQLRDALWARMAQELDRYGHALTFSQYVTLKKLQAGTVGVTELARAAELNPGAMTRLLDRLEEKGLVARRADPDDRRLVHIDLTDAGLAICRDIEACGRRVRERATADMDADERAQFTRLLAQARDNLNAPDN